MYCMASSAPNLFRQLAPAWEMQSPEFRRDAPKVDSGPPYDF